MTDGTPSSSFDETDTSVHDRRQIVSRASLVRCVSRLVDQTGNRQRRRTTIGISNPAAKVAVAKAAMQAEALKTGRKLAGEGENLHVLFYRQTWCLFSGLGFG